MQRSGLGSTHGVKLSPMPVTDTPASGSRMELPSESDCQGADAIGNREVELPLVGDHNQAASSTRRGSEILLGYQDIATSIITPMLALVTQLPKLDELFCSTHIYQAASEALKGPSESSEPRAERVLNYILKLLRMEGKKPLPHSSKLPPGSRLPHKIKTAAATYCACTIPLHRNLLA